VVGRTAPLLRLLGGAAILAPLLAYYAVADDLRNVPLWADVVLTSVVLIPATFALVLLALPLRDVRGLAPVGLAFGILAVVLTQADLELLANFAKVAAVALLAFWFLGFFERPSWVVLVAAIVPFVDAVSVWRGPTRHIVTEEPEVFGALSLSFPVPDDFPFQLGLTDLAFFSIFLGAAARWGLRVGWTWIAMVASLGATIVFTVYVDPFGIGGLPALPGLAVGFLAANADHVVRILRRLDERVLVTLAVSDFDASARFYRDAVDARVKRVEEDGRLHVVADWWADREVGFLVRDLESAHARALAHGAEVVRAPHVEEWGRSAAYLDPDGNVVSLVERA
jgi:predicted enzyme related to lactoylglutathione lyase